MSIIKNDLKAILTKPDKDLMKSRMEIDYHMTRDGYDLGTNGSFIYPSRFVCDYAEQAKEGLQYGFHEEQIILKNGWIQASNRLPDRLKKGKKIAPEYIIMIIISAILSLPISVFTTLFYILRRGHAYITANLHNRRYDIRPYPVKEFINIFTKIIIYGTVVFFVNLWTMKHIFKIDNAWNEFYNLMMEDFFCDITLPNSTLIRNLAIYLMVTFVTGCIISFFINKVIVPLYFYTFSQKHNIFNFFANNISDLYHNVFNFFEGFETRGEEEKKILTDIENHPAFSSLYTPYGNRSKMQELHFYTKHAYVGELSWRFISPFAYRYYCMAYGYYIPIHLITGRAPIPYSIFYRANAYAQKKKYIKYFTK